MPDAGRAKEDVVAQVSKSRNKVVRSLVDLIGFKSVMGPDVGGETDAQLWVSERLRSLGAKVDVWNVTEDVFGHTLKKQRPNCVGVIGGRGTSLILNGHVDVVPAGERSKWSHDPFRGTVTDGKVVGRGACDAKGGLEAILGAVECLVEAGYRPKGKVVVESVMGEESGEGGTLSTIRRGYTADAAIVAEPTDLEIQPQEGGTLWLRLTVPGLCTHPALRWKGIRPGGEADSVNALETGLKVAEALLDLVRLWCTKKRHRLFPRGWSTLSPNLIEGGTALNTIPGSLSVSFNIWYYPDEDPENVKSEVEGAVRAACKGDAWLKSHGPRIEWLLDYPSAATDTDARIVQTLKREHRKVLSREPMVTAFQAVCDMKFLRNEGRMPSVIYGPGSLITAHTPDEYVTVDSLVNATKVLALTIIDWCGVAGE